MKVRIILQRFRQVDVRLALQVYVLLWQAKWRIEFRHLKEIVAWINREDLAQQTVSIEKVKKAHKVARYTRRVAKFVPFESKCYDKALTVKKVLNQQHIPAALNMGVKTGEKNKLEAHAWVATNDRNIIGGEVASEYVLVQTFY